MSFPVLATKLFVPPRSSTLVSRQRLIEQLDAGLAEGRRLSLVSAPAGFGKTTLVSEWLAGIDRPAAWLSLDERDGDPTRFLVYLVHAIQTAIPGIGVQALEALQAPQPPPVEAVLTALINELSGLPSGLVLVLDDLHAIDSQPVDAVLAFLVEHMPPRMHLVVTTREDPALPLHRLRARDQLVELRAMTLRFSAGETAEFINKKMALDLSPEDLAVLDQRTEGWIAGLQLAALSMQGRADVPGFIRDFEGDHRYVVDYLVEEVLNRQPEVVRDFLVKTSILAALNGSLCEAVTGQADAALRLQSLQRGNYFIIPQDDRGQWYRYHHLFGEVLRVHLAAERPLEIADLHRRAAEWFERHGSANDAVRHALAAGDHDRAADLIETAVPAMRQARQESAMLAWFEALPERIFDERPGLCVHHAGTLLQIGKLEGVDRRLRAAEKGLASLAPAGKAIPPESRWIPGWIAVYRAALALLHGDLDNTLAYAQRGLELIPDDDHLGRGAPAGLVGLVYWRRADLEAAYKSYDECLARLQKAGYIPDALGSSVALADIRTAQGRLRDALQIYQRGLQLSTGPGGLPLRGTADMYACAAGILLEQNELDAAREHLARCEALGEYMGLPQNPHRRRIAAALVKLAEGDPPGALDLLDEAERLYQADFFPNVRPIPALRARVWIDQGDLERAAAWAQEQGLAADDQLDYLREFEHITLARLLLARFRTGLDADALAAGMGLLSRLGEAAETGGRTGSLIQILVQQAAGHQLQNDVPAALGCLERAMAAARPEGYIRIFLDGGPAVRDLLERTAGRGYMPHYARALLAAFEGLPAEHPQPAMPQTGQRLVEPLSPRELEILRLLQTDLSGPEIARELVVALSTVRTHTKSIYGKLNANSRRTAIRRARDLGLL